MSEETANYNGQTPQLEPKLEAKPESNKTCPSGPDGVEGVDGITAALNAMAPDEADLVDVSDEFCDALDAIEKHLSRIARKDLNPVPPMLSRDNCGSWQVIASSSGTHCSTVVEAMHVEGAGCLVRSCSISSEGVVAESLQFVPGVEVTALAQGHACLVQTGFKS